MKTGHGGVSVVQVNYAYDKQLTDPDALLERYFTLTGWSRALLGAGARGAAVVQRFHRDARITRDGVAYVFTRDRVAAAAVGSGADVVHVNGIEFPGRTWMLRRAVGRRCALVVQSHSDGGAIGRAPALRLLGRATRRAPDAFLFAADEHASSWRQAGFIAADQPTYRVMPASSTLQPIDRRTARGVSATSGSPAILWVGRLNPNKDPLTVLDGFERALGDLPEATLTMIYGTGELLDAVRRRVEASPPLSRRVRLIGALAHERLAAFYSAADVFLVGSHHEGSGYSVMEACACTAIPVITRIPTFRVLTAGGSIGALWSPGDAADCARALVEVARRDLDAERTKLANHFARELSWEAVGRRAMEIYAQVLEKRETAPMSSSSAPASDNSARRSP